MYIGYKGLAQFKGSPHKMICEVLTLTFTFLAGILPSPTLRTFWAEPVKKTTLYFWGVSIWPHNFFLPMDQRRHSRGAQTNENCLAHY